MRKLGLWVAVCIAVLGLGGTALGEDAAEATAAQEPEETPHPMVAMETTMGTIVVELYPEKAPETVANFLEYVKAGFYDGLIIHRVVPNFVIQGGGFAEDMTRRKTRPAIKNEARGALKNEKYTISMARTTDPHSATSQFFISLRDNTASLDPNPRNKWGYCAFGIVTEGQQVVDAIGRVKTTAKGGMQDVPETAVVIKTAKVVGAETEEKGQTAEEKSESE